MIYFKILKTTVRLLPWLLCAVIGFTLSPYICLVVRAVRFICHLVP